ncbi:aminoacyl-tRNA hydrolase [Liquorilactobacillus mali]|uniref:Peptidyl-tRNA hydrolase n=1 Tax=Liquorilactobacillus mali TaxID=1618 RepID=A0A0R2FLT5_9LACO|nr:aminoacyl-tRNA hydrolase [Liquorilactobacillus mali]KRN27317.1 peptidyl-tRNA hydrolase [Liquorilactobacillus mali]MDN7145997.1 aminoacyl-tRNA hydrolase [Liquorilactobacillus mali]
MKLIVGLGNIGKEYDGTRHNVGFMVLDELAKREGISFNKVKNEATLADFMFKGEKIILAKPLTYMNESGRSVRPLMDFYKIPVEDVIIIHDDMDLPVGHLRLRQKGSAGGHNGIKSLISHLGTQEFKRIKIGIDHPQRMSVVDWVLSRFTKEQQNQLESGINEALEALDNWIDTDDFMGTMNKYNHK